MLSQAHKSAFDERGYLRITDVIEPAAIREAAATVWQRLSLHGIYQNDPASHRRPRPAGLQSIARHSDFNGVFGAPVAALIDELLGVDRWDPPTYWGQLLLSLPGDDAWSVPRKAWHLDLPPHRTTHPVPGVQVFVCLEDIVAHCGATVVATGTHRLVAAHLAIQKLTRNATSAALRKQLSQESDWFKALVSDDMDPCRNERFLDRAHAEGAVQLQVHELTGRQGDLILMHPYLFHAPAPNIGPALRMALTQRVYAR